MIFNFTNKPHDRLNKAQRYFQKKFIFDKKNYKYINLSCICGGSSMELVCNVDRHAIDINFFICKECGIIFQSKYPNNQYLSKFYNEIQKGLYVGNSLATYKYFNFQRSRGKNIFNKWKENTKLINKNNILDIGCGAGGILYEFNNFKNKFGCDYNKNYINFGKKRKLDLHHGDYRYFSQKKFSLILLIQVFEHFSYPLEELKVITKMQEVGSEIIIDIPSIESIDYIYGSPKKYFQFAHPYSYSLNHLLKIMGEFGYENTYLEKNGLMIFRKKSNMIINSLYCKSLRQEKNYIEIRKKIIIDYLTYTFFLSKRRYIDLVKNFLSILSLR